MANKQFVVASLPVNKYVKRTDPSSGGTWGSITGTLANQTDLQAALDANSGGPHYSKYSTLFETSGRFTASGSGSATFGTNGLALATSVTANRAMTLTDNGSGTGNNLRFTSPSIKWCAEIIPFTLPGTTGHQFYGMARNITVNSTTGIDFTSDSEIGFKIITSGGAHTLSATNSNNTTETATSSGVTVTAFNHYLLFFDYTKSTNIKFYVSTNYGTPVLVATHTTNLPLVADETNPFFFGVSNVNTANNVDTRIQYMSCEIQAGL